MVRSHSRGWWGSSRSSPALCHQAQGTPALLQAQVPCQSLGLSVGEQGAKNLLTGKGWDCLCSSAPARHLAPGLPPLFSPLQDKLLGITGITSCHNIPYRNNILNREQHPSVKSMFKDSTPCHWRLGIHLINSCVPQTDGLKATG